MQPLFSWPVRVYYEDTDAGGVVYHANYVQFLERARTEWLRDRGFEQDQLMDQENLLFAVAGMEIRFRRPARFNDLLQVSVDQVEGGRSRMTLDQSVIRDRDGELMTTARVRVACLDAREFRPTPIPKDMAEKLLHE